MSKKTRLELGSHVAMFIDAQNVSNITESQIRHLVGFSYRYGWLKHRSVYIDLLNFDRKAKTFFHAYGFELFDIPGSTETPNIADYRLMEDCQNYVAKNPEIRTVILVSCDRDFVPLVLELQSKNIEVIVVAKHNVSRKLRKEADRCLTFDDLEQMFNSLPIAA